MMQRFAFALLALTLFLWALWQHLFIFNLYLHPDNALGWDSHELWVATEALYAGKNPFDVRNLNPDAHITFPAVIYPGMMLFYLPLLTVSWLTARVILYGINLVLAVASMIYLLRKSSCWTVSSAVFCTLLYLCTSPVIWTLIPGQTSLVMNSLILIALMGTSFIMRAISLALATTLKYSMTPICWLVFASKRQYLLCVIAFVLFLLLSATPMLFGHSLITLYTNYAKHVWGTLLPGGHNHYDGGAGFNFIHFEFLKFGWINLLGKAIVVVGVIIAVVREWRRTGISLNFLFLVSSATMIPVYHRIHDLSLATLFLILVANYFYLQKRWMNLTVAACFLFALCLPIHWEFYDWLGQQIGNNDWFYLGKWGNFTHIPPILGAFTYFLSIYALILYFWCDETYRFADKIQPRLI